MQSATGEPDKKHMYPVGRTRQRLAVKLQRDIPDIRGKAITWLPERLYPHRGRAHMFCDKYAWSGTPVWSGTGNTAGLFDCWRPMTECVRAARLILDGKEVEIG